MPGYRGELAELLCHSDSVRRKQISDIGSASLARRLSKSMRAERHPHEMREAGNVQAARVSRRPECWRAARQGRIATPSKVYPSARGPFM